MSNLRKLLLGASLALARASAAFAEPAATAQHVTVFAAASLTSAFRQIAADFEGKNPGVSVELNFGGSPTLVKQIQEGAQADAFAAADEANMQKIVDAKLAVGEPQIFARNRLTIVVQKGNPKKIASLADLAKPGLAIALGAPGVPAGRYAREAFAKAGVAVPESSQELDVKAVLQKVALGEADAGIVYVTDVAGAEVDAVAIPDEVNVVGKYPVAVLKEGTNRAGGEAFVRCVLSAEGQRVLTKAGFLLP